MGRQSKNMIYGRERDNLACHTRFGSIHAFYLDVGVIGADIASRKPDPAGNAATDFIEEDRLRLSNKSVVTVTCRGPSKDFDVRKPSCFSFKAQDRYDVSYVAQGAQDVALAIYQRDESEKRLSGH